MRKREGQRVGGLCILEETGSESKSRISEHEKDPLKNHPAQASSVQMGKLNPRQQKS